MPFLPPMPCSGTARRVLAEWSVISCTGLKNHELARTSAYNPLLTMQSHSARVNATTLGAQAFGRGIRVRMVGYE